MSRSARLLNLIQCLRARRRPVTASTLADELGISIRTVYRDVATLIGEGVPIEGEAGLGYVLRPGFLLPPLMFSDDEIDAMVLGLRWVSQRGDKSLAAAARDAGAKIISVLPDDLREKAENAGLVTGRSQPPLPSLDLTPLRRAIREERKLRLSYADANGRRSERVVWPFALAFFEHVRVLATWCETRRDFRHFRTDRISDATLLGERYPRRRRVLLSDWRTREGMGEQL